MVDCNKWWKKTFQNKSWIQIRCKWVWKFVGFWICKKKLWESDNIRIRIRTLSHPYSQAMLTVTEQQHRRPSEAAVDHPPSWLASSCWWCGALFVIYHMDIRQCLQGPLFAAGYALLSEWLTTDYLNGTSACYGLFTAMNSSLRIKYNITKMWANAQRDGRPAEYRWRPLFNAAKFGRRPLLEYCAVTLPRCESHWN